MTFTIACVLLIVLGLLGVCIFLVSLLRQRPGLRRRRENPMYDGPPRRFTDCSHEVGEAVERAMNERHDDLKPELSSEDMQSDDTMPKSPARRARKPKAPK